MPAQELPSSERAFCCVQEAATIEDAAMARMFIAMPSMPQCSKCGMGQPTEYYRIDNRYEDRRRKQCRHCEQAYNKVYSRKRYKEDPDKFLARGRDYYQRHRKEVLDRNAKWRRDNPEQHLEYNRNWRLTKLYGLTPERYEEMIKEQDGRCAICNEKAELVVDHDHVTGKPRSLLCRKHNLALGSFGDNPDYLIAAANYVLRWREVVTDAIPLK